MSSDQLSKHLDAVRKNLDEKRPTKKRGLDSEDCNISTKKKKGVQLSYLGEQENIE